MSWILVLAFYAEICGRHGCGNTSSIVQIGPFSSKAACEKAIEDLKPGSNFSSVCISTKGEKK